MKWLQSYFSTWLSSIKLRHYYGVCKFFRDLEQGLRNKSARNINGALRTSLCFWCSAHMPKNIFFWRRASVETCYCCLKHLLFTRILCTSDRQMFENSTEGSPGCPHIRLCGDISRSRLLEDTACVARSLDFCEVNQHEWARTFSRGRVCDAVHVHSVGPANVVLQLVSVLSRVSR